MRALIYVVAAIQALFLHRKYDVSGEYMELALRIEMLRKLEHWSYERYQQELAALYLRYPNGVKRHTRSFESPVEREEDV